MTQLWSLVVEPLLGRIFSPEERLRNSWADVHLTFWFGLWSAAKICIWLSLSRKPLVCFFWEVGERPENIPVRIDCPDLGEFHGLELKTLHEDPVRLSYDPVRLLGIYLDPFLSFEAHIDKLVRKCDVGINMMRALAGSGWGMRGKLLKIVFNRLIESVLFYGLEVWGHAAMRKRNLSKFRRIFASGARAICRGSRSANYDGLMECAGIIPPEFCQCMFTSMTRTHWQPYMTNILCW